MKKQIIIIVVLIIGLAGCTQQEEPQPTSADAGLVKVDAIKRLISAKDVTLNDSYAFAITNEVGDNDNLDYYKLSSVLQINVANDSKYVLYSSTENTQNTEEMKSQEFSNDININISEPTYFVLEAIERPIEVTISTME